MSELRPTDTALVRRLADLYLDRGDAKKALDATDGFSKELKSLSSSLDAAKKSISDAVSTAKNAKSQADKAFSKADQLGKKDKN